jgi:hypothetical protein
MLGSADQYRGNFNRCTLIIEMICPLGINEHAIWIVQKALWRAEVYLGAQRACIVPRYWCTCRNIGLRVCGSGILCRPKRDGTCEHRKQNVGKHDSWRFAWEMGRMEFCWRQYPSGYIGSRIGATVQPLCSAVTKSVYASRSALLGLHVQARLHTTVLDIT